MPTATITAHHGKTGTTTYKVTLASHVTLNGREDHFALASHDARMIARGLQFAMPEHRIAIVEINAQAPGGENSIDGRDIHDIQLEAEKAARA